MAQARWTTSHFRFVRISSNNIKKFNLLNSFKNLDYTCCPDEEKPEEFWAYLADRKYDLIPGDDYLQKIKSKISLTSYEPLSPWTSEIIF